jgi:hypothetical protein
LNTQFEGLAILSHWAATTLRIAWIANARTQIHQGLIEICCFSPWQDLPCRSPHLSIASATGYWHINIE